MAQPNTGSAFGSPEAPVPADGYYGYGFGAPVTQADLDAGHVDACFGHPEVAPHFSVFPLLGSPITSDGGGRVELQAELWPDETFRVILRDVLGVAHPSTGGAYSGVAGQGDQITRRAGGQVLQFATPALPPGTYTVEVSWGLGFGNVVVATNPIRVVTGGRRRGEFAMRRFLPPKLATGPQRMASEPLLEG